jgi:hypothetical protein
MYGCTIDHGFSRPKIPRKSLQYLKNDEDVNKASDSFSDLFKGSLSRAEIVAISGPGVHI